MEENFQLLEAEVLSGTINRVKEKLEAGIKEDRLKSEGISPIKRFKPSSTKVSNMEDDLANTENTKSLENTSSIKPTLPKVSIVVGSLWLEQCDRIPKVEKRVRTKIS